MSAALTQENTLTVSSYTACCKFGSLTATEQYWIKKKKSLYNKYTNLLSNINVELSASTFGKLTLNTNKEFKIKITEEGC